MRLNWAIDTQPVILEGFARRSAGSGSKPGGVFTIRVDRDQIHAKRDPFGVGLIMGRIEGRI